MIVEFDSEVVSKQSAGTNVEGLEKRNIGEEEGLFYLKTLLVVKNV